MTKNMESYTAYTLWCLFATQNWSATSNSDYLVVLLYSIT